MEIAGANIGFFSKGLEVIGPLTNVTMTGSTIAASGTGIAVQNSGATPVSLTAHYNRIVADTYAIETEAINRLASKTTGGAATQARAIRDAELRPEQTGFRSVDRTWH